MYLKVYFIVYFGRFVTFCYDSKDSTPVFLNCCKIHNSYRLIFPAVQISRFLHNKKKATISTMETVAIK